MFIDHFAPYLFHSRLQLTELLRDFVHVAAEGAVEFGDLKTLESDGMLLLKLLQELTSLLRFPVGAGLCGGLDGLHHHVGGLLYRRVDAFHVGDLNRFHRLNFALQILGFQF